MTERDRLYNIDCLVASADIFLPNLTLFQGAAKP